MMILYMWYHIIGIGTWAWGDKSYWNYDPRLVKYHFNCHIVTVIYHLSTPITMILVKILSYRRLIIIAYRRFDDDSDSDDEVTTNNSIITFISVIIIITTLTHHLNNHDHHHIIIVMIIITTIIIIIYWRVGWISSIPLKSMVVVNQSYC